ncbi:MAG: hypothetical protein U0172_02730 [Nitrospiraceae bacterium]
MQSTLRKKVARTAFLALCVVGILAPTPAKAMLVTYAFQGAITQVSDNLFTPSGTGSNGMNTGLQLRGTYTFNTLSAPAGNGNFHNALTSLTVQIGNYSATQSFGQNLIQIQNGQVDRYHLLSSVSGNTVKGLSPSMFEILFRDPTGAAFSSNAQLPSTPPSLNSFNTNRWRLSFGSNGFVQGSITSLRAVPLPASVILFGAGLIALIGLGAGRFRQTQERTNTAS